MTGVSRREALGLFSGLIAMGLLPAQAQDAPELAGMTLGDATPFDPADVATMARANPARLADCGGNATCEASDSSGHSV